MDVRILAETPDLPTSIAFLVVIATATMILMLTLRRRSNSSSRSTSTTSSSPLQSIQSSRQASDEMRQLLIELQEFARQTVGQIDSRTRKLEVLIRDADARLARLEEVDLSSESVSRPTSVSGASAVPTSSLDILVGDAGPTRPAPDRHPPDPAVSAERRTVYELADKGLSAIDIAKKLNRPAGEIELMLSLRAQSAATKAVG